MPTKQEAAVTVQFVSQDLEWTESMKECVQRKIVDPLHRHLATENFELSVHIGLERKRLSGRKPKFEMWLVLQTFDGKSNEVVRGDNEQFLPLVSAISRQMRTRVNKLHSKKSFLGNPFKRTKIVERTA
jgi:ribosome-associated translation inhibitor RaiA